MRLILGIIFLLSGVGLWACSLEGVTEQVVAQPPAVQWVRTVDGWERSDHWHVPRRSFAGPPRLHPLVVAAGQGLTSVMALVTCGVARPAHNGRVRKR